jgi:hypothetical protein
MRGWNRKLKDKSLDQSLMKETILTESNDLSNDSSDDERNYSLAVSRLTTRY